MTTLVTVLRSGGRYTPQWVERLTRGARCFVPELRQVRCLTDLDVAIDGVECVPLRHGWPGWWAKMEAFRPGLSTGTTVLCDLDTVFTAPAKGLGAGDLTALEDHFHKGRLSSALMRWTGDELAFVYERFAADPARWMEPGACGDVPNAVHGDQVVIDHLLREAGIKPAFWQDRHPGLVDFYDPSKAAPGPLVVFIGPDKPDTAVGPVARLWHGPSTTPADALEPGADQASPAHERQRAE